MERGRKFCIVTGAYHKWLEERGQVRTWTAWNPAQGTTRVRAERPARSPAGDESVRGWACDVDPIRSGVGLEHGPSAADSGCATAYGDPFDREVSEAKGSPAPCSDGTGGVEIL